MAQRDRRVLHDRPNLDGELLLAARALPQESGVTRAAVLVHHHAHLGVATARARWSVRPPLFLEECDRCTLVGACEWQFREKRRPRRTCFALLGHAIII